MKRVLLLFMALLFIPAIKAQQWPKDNIITYISYAPEENGMGFRIDIKGGYLSYIQGHYKLSNGDMIKNHKRLSAGLTYKTISIGLVYHNSDNPKELPHILKKPITPEFGARTKIEWFSAAIRFDPLRWEGIFEFGVSF